MGLFHHTLHGLKQLPFSPLFSEWMHMLGEPLTLQQWPTGALFFPLPQKGLLLKEILPICFCPCQSGILLLTLYTGSHINWREVHYWPMLLDDSRQFCSHWLDVLLIVAALGPRIQCKYAFRVCHIIDRWADPLLCISNSPINLSISSITERQWAFIFHSLIIFGRPINNCIFIGVWLDNPVGKYWIFATLDIKSSLHRTISINNKDICDLEKQENMFHRDYAPWGGSSG